MTFKILSRCDADEAKSIADNTLFEIGESDLSSDSYLMDLKTELSKEAVVISHSIGVERSHEYTAELAQLDGLFDGRMICLKTFITANTYSSDDTIAGNAEKVWAKLKAYDLDFYKLGYEKELSRVFSMIEEFEIPELKAKIDSLVGVANCMSEVKSAANNLQELYRKNQGILATKEDVIPSTTQAKVIIEIMNSDLLPYLSVMSKVKPAEYDKTFAKIYQYIETVNTKIRTRRTRSTSVDTNSEVE